MTARRRVLPNFGQFLVTARERAKRWGTPAFAKHAKALGLHHISENKLKQHESGITSDVRAEFLRDLSVLYQTPYAVLLRALVVEKYGFDFSTGAEVPPGDTEEAVASIATSLERTSTVTPQQTDTQAEPRSVEVAEARRMDDQVFKRISGLYDDVPPEKRERFLELVRQAHRKVYDEIEHERQLGKPSARGEVG